MTISLLSGGILALVCVALGAVAAGIGIAVWMGLMAERASAREAAKRLLTWRGNSTGD